MMHSLRHMRGIIFAPALGLAFLLCALGTSFQAQGSERLALSFQNTTLLPQAQGQALTLLVSGRSRGMLHPCPT